MNTEQSNENVIIGKIRQNPHRYPSSLGNNKNGSTAPLSNEQEWRTDQELVIKPHGSFLLRKGMESIWVSVPDKFFSTETRYKAGTALWAKLEFSAGSNPRLLQLMETDVHDRLSGIDENVLNRMLDKLSESPERLRREILQRRFNRKTQKEDMRALEIGKDLFLLTYMLSKQSFSLEQRDRIERLMPTRGMGFREKAELQLDYVFNISEEYGKRTFLDYAEIMVAFDEHIYGQKEQKHRIAELLAHRSLADDRGVKILLVGSEGSGKSLFREVIQDLVQLPSAVIELGGESNPCALIGHNATYADADAGDILKTFRKLRTTEALIGWTGIDKTGDSREGVAINALKGIISEDCLVDKFTLYPLSTRHTIHIAEATSDQNLPGFITSGFEIIRMDAYSEDDKVNIAREHLVPKLCKKTWLSDVLLQRKPEESALRFIARNFSGGEGMKEMESCCAMVVKRMVQEELDGRSLPFDEKTVRLVLGDNPDRSNPLIRHNLALGQYSPEVEAAILDTRERLKNEKLRPEERSVEELRLGYLVDMNEGAPSRVRFDRDQFLRTMNETHIGLGSVKEMLADHFASQAARGSSFAGMRLLLEGPAGVGKTSIIASMAKALSASYVRVPLNNISEASTLKGLYKTYASADAGMIIKGIAEAKRRMPDAPYIVVHLDEVDKLASQFNDILIDLLDDSGLFLDYLLGVPVKLSNILFCGTANDISRIPLVILDRFQRIHLDGYTHEEKAHILREHLIPAKEREYAASKLTFTMDERTQDLLLSSYCPSAGVRDLKKAVDRLTEYAVSHRGRRSRLELNELLLRQALGEAPMECGNLPGHWLPGCAKALSVDDRGVGSCFAVESVVLPGEKGLTITGLAGESTVESVKIAVTYLKSRYACARGPLDIHLSFGEGAVRKDGPSAGVAVLVSLLSAMNERCSDPAAAYTGEIDLLGNIYPVGGVMRKIYAAERAGCSCVFVPEENVNRLTPQERASVSLEIIPVTHVEEVIQAVFEAYEGLRGETASAPRKNLGAEATDTGANKGGNVWRRS